jgi:hypothetical protein
MKHLAAAAISAALLAGVSGAAFAQTTPPAAPTAASPTQPSHAATVAPHATMMHRVARYSDKAGDPGTKALNLLEANGYTDVTQFRQVGGDYQATVTKDGKPVTVTVDPGTGQIQTRA